MDLPIHPYAHYLLYAKGHYAEREVDGTIWGDMKRIHSHYYAIDEHYISKSDVINCLVRAVQETVKVDLLDFISSIDPESCWRIWPRNYSPEDYNYYEAIVYKCLSLLRYVTVLDDNRNPILNLGDVDETILNKKGDLYGLSNTPNDRNNS